MPVSHEAAHQHARIHGLTFAPGHGSSHQAPYENADDAPLHKKTRGSEEPRVAVQN
jgi:hypothetical protein